MAFGPTDPSHAVRSPTAAGFVVVSDGRHRTATGILTGAPRERCYLNDPDVLGAEYLFGDRQSAEAAVGAKARRWGLGALRRPTLEVVEVVLDPTPVAAGGPPMAIANAHSYMAPAAPTPGSQQFGMLWADAQWSGLETGLAEPPPAGSQNRWCCVFVGRGLTVRRA